jgi:hypothetical protein
MTMERTTRTESNRPPGILEHLSEGMSLVLEFPHLIMVPVLVDLYLLLGPQVSSESLTMRLGEWFIGRGGETSVDTGEWIRDLGSWDGSRLLALLMPSVPVGLPQDQLYRPFDRLTWSPASLVVVAAGAVMALIGFAIFITYLTMLASRAKLIRTSSVPLLHLLVDRWAKVLGFAGLLIGVLAIILAVLVLPAALMSAGGIGTDGLVFLLSLIGFVILVITMFVPEAIVIDGAGPISAVRASASVVFRFFWQSAAFLAVSLMISPGLLSIWERIAGDPAGLAIAVVLNAIMVTSLSLASLAFYRARFDGVAPLPQPI